MKIMNKGLYFNLVFMIVGTVLLITVGGIVTVNFLKDSRMLHPAATVQVAEAPTPAPTNETETPDKETTYKYTRAADAVPEKPVDFGEEDPRHKPTPAPKNAPKNIKVEVLNYSGIKKLAEEVRAMLEANGYTVSAGNATSTRPVATTIIEWNGKKAGSEIQKLLKAGKIMRSEDPTSRFDVTVTIGDDYKP